MPDIQEKPDQLLLQVQVFFWVLFSEVLGFTEVSFPIVEIEDTILDLGCDPLSGSRQTVSFRDSRENVNVHNEIA